MTGADPGRTESGPSWREIALRVMKRVISHTTAWATRERTRSFTIMPTRAAASISARYRTPASGSRWWSVIAEIVRSTEAGRIGSASASPRRKLISG